MMVCQIKVNMSDIKLKILFIWNNFTLKKKKSLNQIKSFFYSHADVL